MNLAEAKRHKKFTSSEISTPPFFLRRRLSAPETIMRKHVLAQQRSSSQESHKSSDSDSPSNWPGGSDPNLSRRKNTDIRRSTLMKRFWESSKGNMNFPSSYSEWQYRLKHGSPENRSQSMKSLLSSDSPKHSIRQSPRRKQSTYANTPKSEEDSYVVYSSNITTESTDNTARTEASDSYPLSSETQTESTNNHQKQNKVTKAYRINNDGISDVTDNSQIPNLPIKYQFVINENQNQYEFQPQVLLPQASATSTNGSNTNLNVITNVQLSQSTLNLIFNQVMQDVLQKPPQEPEKIQDNLLKQKAYNFKLNIDEKQQKPDKTTETSRKYEKLATPRSSRIVNSSDSEGPEKCISDVNAGSPYRNLNSPSVPRLSALPRTSSMEVNISSNDSFDKDSDTSLVDSLEDPSSPRFKMKRKTIVKETELKTKEVESTSDGQQHDIIEDFTKKSFKKSSVFYIPIDNNLIELESDSQPGVSDLLPDKLKERLLKRQMKREEKRMQERMKQFDIENGNVSNFTNYFSTSPESSTTMKSRSKPKRSNTNTRTKTTLPQIDLRKDYDKSLRSTYTQRSLNRYRESVDNPNKNKSFWLPKTRTKQTTQTSHKSKQTSSSTKHIEILEIMEIVEPERSTVHLTPKAKSRIPVFQHPNSGTKLPKLKPKPSFLDFDTLTRVDPKLDQLIANILIDTLNHEADAPRPKSNNSLKQTDNKQKQPQTATASESNNNPNPNLLDSAADILTKQVLVNNNLDTPKMGEHLDNVQMEDIPKGWITFYTLQKNQSPDSTSDEGQKTATKSTQYMNYYENDNNLGISDESGSDYLASHRKLRRKSKNLPEGWSMTFSGHNHGEVAPEVEMKFKFPQLSQNQKTVTKTKTRSDQSKSKDQGLNFEEACGNVDKSEIHKSKQYLKEPTNVTNRRKLTTLMPRPTKTSRQRTLLHRRRHSYANQPSDLDFTLPEVLSINGNAFNQIRRLPKLDEQDLKRLLLRLKHVKQHEHHEPERDREQQQIDN